MVCNVGFEFVMESFRVGYVISEVELCSSLSEWQGVDRDFVTFC